ncbi:OLC1v1036629C1 [Oldenlandia corymbosa var. corymbosa]|uniref:OLC1v1036629C1 n=1 Tax=Oldenlandia corymbosa var. corymbosa TaxID=529605 RepID=A0AAV1CXU0_OLDCO|nr:OLC1v1036629C1 [Oldenlandia corymbosa var. corymbosa]
MPPALSFWFQYRYLSKPASIRSVRYLKSANGREETGKENCDLFTGDWIPDPNGPYYTNATYVSAFPSHSNCMKNGRPDSNYLKWRWKPDGCELPKFDPERFLELVRGKSMAFVGDSLARNHMQSLGCLLSRVAVPEDVSPKDREEWVYKDYNFNMSSYWTVFFTRSERSKKGPDNIYLDEFNEYWTSKIANYDYMIISAGQWWFVTSMYYENRRLFGCNKCKEESVPDIGFYSAYQKALRTSLRAMRELAKPGATFFIRSVSPDHFEGGSWYNGGYCNRTKPFRRLETDLDPYSAVLRGIQMEELKIAQEEGNKKGLRFGMIDVTPAMRLRPDGHPDIYRRPNEEVVHDCVHWCLPGPIDVWNEFLLQLLIRDQDPQNPNHIR